jgi:hypothetical protein
MRFTALVQSVDRKQGTSKATNQAYDMTNVTVIDFSKTGKRCQTPIEFTLAKEDEDLRDKLEGQTVEVELTKLGVFKGRLDCQARVVRNQPAAGAGPKA